MSLNFKTVPIISSLCLRSSHWPCRRLSLHASVSETRVITWIRKYIYQFPVEWLVECAKVNPTMQDHHNPCNNSAKWKHAVFKRVVFTRDWAAKTDPRWQKPPTSPDWQRCLQWKDIVLPRPSACVGIQLEREVLGDVDVPREAGEYVKNYLVQSTVCYAHTGYKERSIVLYMSKKTDQALILGHRVKEKSVSMVIQDRRKCMCCICPRKLTRLWFLATESRRSMLAWSSRTDESACAVYVWENWPGFDSWPQGQGEAVSMVIQDRWKRLRCICPRRLTRLWLLATGYKEKSVSMVTQDRRKRLCCICPRRLTRLWFLATGSRRSLLAWSSRTDESACAVYVRENWPGFDS